MQESKRQKQVGGLIQEEINGIFQRMGLTFIEGTMISVASVKITPDLLEARIYLSVYNNNKSAEVDRKAILKKFDERKWEVKKELAARVKQQLRRIPELKFFIDDTLDHVFKMEQLFAEIKSTQTDAQPNEQEKSDEDKES